LDPLPHAPSPNLLVSGTPPSSIVNNSPQASCVPPPPPLPSVGRVEQMMSSFELSQDAIMMRNIVEHPKSQALNHQPFLSSEMPQVVISGNTFTTEFFMHASSHGGMIRTHFSLSTTEYYELFRF